MRRWSPALRRLEWLVARPIAHRGLHDAGRGTVENTESAFAAAMAGGYTIECDVQLSADGEAVVFHDATLDRLMDAKGPVAARNARDLKSIAFKSGGDRIQTLAELLEQIDGRVPLVIEIKSRWDGDDALAARALAVLAPCRGPHCLMSFDPEAIAAVRARSPSTVRGIVADRATHACYRNLDMGRRLGLRHFTHAHDTAPHFISYHWPELPFAPINRFRATGRPVIAWTIRSPEAAAAARRYSDQITFEGFAA